MIAWCSLLLILPLVLLILKAWRQYLTEISDGHALNIPLCGIVLPLLSSAGFLGLLWDREGVLGSSGSLVVGTGPLIFGLVTGWLLVSSPLASTAGGSSNRFIQLVSGLVLVMIAAAGRVPHTVGLIACAIGLVLIWLTSLQSREVTDSVKAGEARQQPLSLIVAVAGSLLLAFCTRLAPSDWMPLVMVVLIVEVLVMLRMLMNSRGGTAVFEAAGWLAVLLPCLGLGLLGQDRLVVLIRGHDLPGLPPAMPTLRSTQELLIPGVTILLSVLFWSMATRVPPGWRGTLGACLIVVASLGLFRLAVGPLG